MNVHGLVFLYVWTGALAALSLRARTQHQQHQCIHPASACPPYISQVLAEYKPFCFVGMVGLEEAVRPNAIPYLRRLQRMNVLIVMFTNESLGVWAICGPGRSTGFQYQGMFAPPPPPLVVDNRLLSSAVCFLILVGTADDETMAQYDRLLSFIHPSRPHKSHSKH